MTRRDRLADAAARWMVALAVVAFMALATYVYLR